MSAILTEFDLHAGLSAATREELLTDMRRGHRAALTVAMAQQAQLKGLLDAEPETWSPGLGPRVMHVPSVVYFEMIRRYGAEVWRDPDFRRKMVQDEPSLRVETRARNTTVRVNGRREGDASTSNVQRPTSNVQVRGTQASAGARTEGGDS
jgi:hypothetical protein